MKMCILSDFGVECSGQCWACLFERSDKYEDAQKNGQKGFYPYCCKVQEGKYRAQDFPWRYSVVICPFGFYIECPYDDMETCICYPECINNLDAFNDDMEDL